MSARLFFAVYCKSNSYTCGTPFASDLKTRTEPEVGAVQNNESTNILYEANQSMVSGGGGGSDVPERWKCNGSG
jgi:hypothetical protein